MGSSLIKISHPQEEGPIFPVLSVFFALSRNTVFFFNNPMASQCLQSSLYFPLFIPGWKNMYNLYPVKDPDAGKDWRQKEKGAAEEEMVR